MIVKKTTGVLDHTTPAAQRRIDRLTYRRVERLRQAPASEIRARLEALDREWDVERAVQAGVSASALAALVLGKLKDRRYFLLSGAGCGFLLQQALSGWCPPVAALRALGFRTVPEIEAERRALLDVLGERGNGDGTRA